MDYFDSYIRRNSTQFSGSPLLCNASITFPFNFGNIIGVLEVPLVALVNTPHALLKVIQVELVQLIDQVLTVGSLRIYFGSRFRYLDGILFQPLVIKNSGLQIVIFLFVRPFPWVKNRFPFVLPLTYLIRSISPFRAYVLVN